jgi:hypothetical protein
MGHESHQWEAVQGGIGQGKESKNSNEVDMLTV